MKHILFLTAVLVFSLGFSTTKAAGNISGTVTDTLTAEPLVGANVILIGTAFGAATDFEGNYRLRRVPDGEYTMRVSYIGYVTREFPISVADENIAFDVQLKLDVIEGQEVLITAQASGQAAAINQQLRSNTIKNIVSAEKILELPDANAAESVGRLPGISVMRSGGEGSKVVIRGLSPTYNTITIGGAKIPATDLNDRSVDLSMISPEILAGIEVTKALTPDKDADAFGGSVDFQLASARKGGFYQNIRLQTGYNNLRQEAGLYKGRIVVSDRFLDDKLGVMITGNIEQTQRGSDVYEASWGTLREKREGEEFAPLTSDAVEFQYRLSDRQRVGFSAMFDYETEANKFRFNTFLSRRDNIGDRWDVSFNVGSGWINRDFRLTEEKVDILSNSLSGDHNLDYLQIDWRVSSSKSETNYPANDRFRFKQTAAFRATEIPAQSTPDDILAAAITDTLGTAHLYAGFRNSEFAIETENDAQINFEVPYSLTNDLAGYLKFGAKFRHRTRERDRGQSFSRLDYRGNKSRMGEAHSMYGTPGWEYQLVEGTGYASMYNYIDDDFDEGDFLNGDYPFGVAADKAELIRLRDDYLLDSLYIYTSSQDLEDYEVEENIASAYIMTELKVGSWLMFMPGVRYERTYSYLTGRKGNVSSDQVELALEQNPIKDTTSVSEFNNWFPMVHLRIMPVEWFDLRVAFTKTISRPRLDYLLPSVKIMGSSQAVDIGRPDLSPQLSTNLDAYLSLYGNEIGLITVGGYYKDISNLIYYRAGKKILNAEEEGFPESWQGLTLGAPENNIHKTEVYGIELEWQSNFSWLPSPFDGLVINANFTHIWSETRFPRSLVQSERINTFPYVLTTVIDTFRVGNMPNQADDIANLSIGYDVGGFSGRVSMLFQGKTLTSVGERPEDDNYSSDYIRWDLSMKYDVNEYLGFFFNLNNITNEADEAYRQFEQFTTDQEFYGWTSDLGLILKL